MKLNVKIKTLNKLITNKAIRSDFNGHFIRYYIDRINHCKCKDGCDLSCIFKTYATNLYSESFFSMKALLDCISGNNELIKTQQLLGIRNNTVSLMHNIVKSLDSTEKKKTFLVNVLRAVKPTTNMIKVEKDISLYLLNNYLARANIDMSAKLNKAIDLFTHKYSPSQEIEDFKYRQIQTAYRYLNQESYTAHAEKFINIIKKWS